MAERYDTLLRRHIRRGALRWRVERCCSHMSARDAATLMARLFMRYAATVATPILCREAPLLRYATLRRAIATILLRPFDTLRLRAT